MYLLNTLQLLIIDSGRTHDASVFQKFPIAQTPERYFEDQAGYIIGDAAYPLSNWLIKPYPHVDANENEDAADNMAFNVLLSSARVNVEHAIGLLKMRFPLLRQISMMTGYAEDNERVVRMIRALCTLHNFYLGQDDALELTVEERQTLQVWTDNAFESIENSEWREAIGQEEAVNAEHQHVRHLGHLKRDNLREIVKDVRKSRRPFWWRR
jgi:DDE superfamily endonuclease